MMIRNLRKFIKNDLIKFQKFNFFWSKAQKTSSQQQNKSKINQPQTNINSEINFENIAHLIRNVKEQNKKKQPLIPQKSIEDQQKITVVLEADELLYYVFSPDEHEAYMSQPSKDYDFCVYYQDYDTYLSIYKRPHLDQFLKYLRENTEPILYTNGVKTYVDLVMSLIDPEKTFKYIICQEEGSARIIDEKENLDEYFKDLDSLNRDMSKLLYIDSKPFQFWSNPDNCVPVREYQADSTIIDNELLNIMEFIEEMKNEKDVREICADKFNVKQAFIDTSLL